MPATCSKTDSLNELLRGNPNPLERRATCMHPAKSNLTRPAAGRATRNDRLRNSQPPTSKSTSKPIRSVSFIAKSATINQVNLALQLHQPFSPTPVSVKIDARNECHFPFQFQKVNSELSPRSEVDVESIRCRAWSQVHPACPTQNSNPKTRPTRSLFTPMSTALSLSRGRAPTMRNGKLNRRREEVMGVRPRHARRNLTTLRLRGQTQTQTTTTMISQLSRAT
jgi:hypothetical protein